MFYTHTGINRSFVKGRHNHERAKAATGEKTCVKSGNGSRYNEVSTAALQVPTVSFILPLLNSTSFVEWHEQLRVFQHKRTNIRSGSIITLFLRYNTVLKNSKPNAVLKFCYCYINEKTTWPKLPTKLKQVRR